MRILNEIDEISLKKIILFLTMEEALELRDSLNDLIERPLDNHSHITSDDYKKEVTVCIYDLNNLEGFGQKAIDLIQNDE